MTTKTKHSTRIDEYKALIYLEGAIAYVALMGFTLVSAHNRVMHEKTRDGTTTSDTSVNWRTVYMEFTGAVDKALMMATSDIIKSAICSSEDKSQLTNIRLALVGLKRCWSPVALGPDGMGVVRCGVAQIPQAHFAKMDDLSDLDVWLIQRMMLFAQDAFTDDDTQA